MHELHKKFNIVGWIVLLIGVLTSNIFVNGIACGIFVAGIITYFEYKD